MAAGEAAGPGDLAATAILPGFRRRSDTRTVELRDEDVSEPFRALFEIRADTQEILAVLREDEDEAEEDEP